MRRGRVIIEGDSGRFAIVIAVYVDGHRVLALCVQRVAIRNEGVVRINLRRIRGNGDGLLIEEAAACIVIGHDDIGRENLRLGFIIVEGNRSGGAGAVAIHVDRHGVLALRVQRVAIRNEGVVRINLRRIRGNGDGLLIEEAAVCIVIGHGDIGRENLRRGRIVIEGDGGRFAIVIAIQRDGHRVLALRVQGVTGGNEGIVRINLRRIRGNGDGLLIEEAAACIVIGHDDIGRENLRLGFIIVEGNRSGGAGAVAVHVDRHGVLALRAQGVACGRLAVICPDIHSAGGDGAGFLRQIVVVRIIVINREVYCDRAGTVHERDGCGSAAAVAVHRYIHVAFAHQLVAVGRIAVLGRYIVILARTHGGEGLVQRIAVHIHIIDRHLRFNRRGRRRGGRIGLGGNIQAELRGKLAGRIIGQHIQIAHAQLRARIHIG